MQVPLDASLEDVNYQLVTTALVGSRKRLGVAEITSVWGYAMSRCLLSIDWDYFVATKEENWGSFTESKKGLVDLWYKRYLKAKAEGTDLQDMYKLSPAWRTFWQRLEGRFTMDEDTKMYVTDSHLWSYKIAKKHDCRTVCLFDSHADLGYGGLSSLDFEVNCSNWLGRLLKDEHSENAHIVYSPHTLEKPEHFQEINSMYTITYYTNLDDLDGPFNVSAIHVCRSGAWTPPWFDDKFVMFVEALGKEYEVIDCPKRKWDTKSLSLSRQIAYLFA